MAKLLLTGIDQVGIVVRDIQKAMDYYSSTFGIGPFRVLEADMPDLIVHGKISSVKFKAAFARVGPVQFELIQNMEGESIYTEFLKAKGEGLHHLGIRVAQVDEEVARLEEQGIGVLQRGKSAGVSFAYLQTEEIGGVIFELIPKRGLLARE